MIKRNKWAGFLQVHPDLLMNYLRVVDVYKGPLRQKVPDQRDRSRLARITSVGLEGETKDSDALGEIEVPESTRTSSD